MQASAGQGILSGMTTRMTIRITTRITIEVTRWITINHGSDLLSRLFFDASAGGYTQVIRVPDLADL